jgi:hypothetical protein
VKEFSVGDIGSVVQISMGGMIIQKAGKEVIEEAELIIPLLDHEIHTEIIWQDKDSLGLRYADEFDAAPLIKTLIHKIREPEPRPEKIISDNLFPGIMKRDLLSSCINLMEELEDPDIDPAHLKIYVEEIGNVCRETAAPKEMTSDVSEEIDASESAEPEDLETLLNHEARRALSDPNVEIRDIDFAIARLGLDAVKKIAEEFLRKKLSDRETSLPGFPEYESYVILKTVIFKRLTQFFGFTDKEGEGRLLLSLETKGIEMLMSLSSGDAKKLKEYYISPQRVYSEISRTYEKNCFGTDLLSLNKVYFEHIMGRCEDLYDGYVLAHLMLNPCCTPGSSIKLTLTNRQLIFSFLVYLAVIATKFVIDKDRESAFVLVHMLKRAGLDEGRVMEFLNDGITEANELLKKLGLSAHIRGSRLPGASFKIDSYLHKGIHYKYLVNSFKDFSVLKSMKRMALRYEDDGYTHFILNKLLIADDIGLNAKAYCVIPCSNISEHELYIDEFSYFDFVIFKNVDSLPVSHIKEFVKLWNSFEGKIITTFSTYSYLDFDNKDLYLLLKDYIVDFPSYFSDRGIYERMIDHTIKSLKPYRGEQVIDREKYSGETCSMNYIKSCELQC